MTTKAESSPSRNDRSLRRLAVLHLRVTPEAKTPSPRNPVEDWAKWIGIVVSLGGFIWGITNFLITNRIQAQTQQLEARKPFLDYQIKLYKEAVKATQVIATSNNAAEKQKSTIRFWELYWGELGLVENGGLEANKNEQNEQTIEAAMVVFGDCLKDPSCSVETSKDGTTLQQRSLDLAHACRNSLAVSYGVDYWHAPVYDEKNPKPTPSSTSTPSSTPTTH